MSCRNEVIGNNHSSSHQALYTLQRSQPYKMQLTNLLFLSAASSLALASPLQSRNSRDKRSSALSLPLSTNTIFQFDTLGYWIENIAVRQNGDLLLTVMEPSALLYRVSNPWEPTPNVELLYNFSSSVNGLLGIAETKPDTFVLVGGNFSSAAVGIPGTSAAWEVKFNSDQHSQNGTKSSAAAVSVRKIADITDAVFLNGLAALPSCGGDAVLIADSKLGLVYRLDTRTGQYEIAVQVPEMAPVPNQYLDIGVNGVKVHKGYLYFDNGFGSALYRIKINAAGFPATGSAVETVAQLGNAPFVDDFAFGPDGSIWVASNLGNTIVRIAQNATGVVVAGAADEVSLLGDTAVAFGRTKEDQDILYVVTAGGSVETANGTTITETGKVVAVRTSDL